MTSGSFHSIELAKIIVAREERQRHDLADVGLLADSVRRLGLIHPIVITRSNMLVAGERRLEACRSLGWSHIPCQYTDEVEEHMLLAIELEENVKRVDLEWQEKCLAIEKYHSHRLSTEEGWSQEKTADALGFQQPYISKNLSLAKEISSGRSDIVDIPRFSTAIGKIAKEEARRDEETLQQILKAKAASAPNYKEPPKSIIHGDFISWAAEYSGPRFNFIHCDFPYGIEADKMQQGGSVATHGGYTDSAETYFSLLMALCDNLNRLATDSCHIMFWFSMHYYNDTMAFFESHSDFILDPFPLIWLKSDNIGLLPDPQRGPRRIYETAFFGSRGDRKVVSSVSNAYAAPTDRSIHMSAKPEPVLRHFFRMFCDSSTLMLDPTCGSGTSLRAAESLSARYVLGVECNSDFAGRAQLELDKSRRLRNASTKSGTVRDVTRRESEAAETEPAADSVSISDALSLGGASTPEPFEGSAE